MASEIRQLANTQLTRMTFLDTAFAKNAVTGGVLKAATQTRLTNARAAFRPAYDALAPLKQNLALLTQQKTNFFNGLYMKSSHFIQVLNFEIAEGNLVPADRAYYKLDVNSEKLPEMGSDEKLEQVAKDLIKGEADRIAAGGTALIYLIVRVNTAFTPFEAILATHSTAKDALDTAQEALEQLEPETDKTIKKVADEVELNHSEEQPASRRANCMEWGVKYVLKGSNKHVDGFVRSLATNQPIPGAKVYFENGNSSAITDVNGFFELNTTLMGTQKLQAEHNIYQDFEMDIALVENDNVEELELKMVGL